MAIQALPFDDIELPPASTDAAVGTTWPVVDFTLMKTTIFLVVSLTLGLLGNASAQDLGAETINGASLDSIPAERPAKASPQPELEIGSFYGLVDEFLIGAGETAERMQNAFTRFTAPRLYYSSLSGVSVKAGSQDYGLENVADRIVADRMRKDTHFQIEDRFEPHRTLRCRLACRVPRCGLSSRPRSRRNSGRPD